MGDVPLDECIVYDHEEPGYAGPDTCDEATHDGVDVVYQELLINPQGGSLADSFLGTQMGSQIRWGSE